MESRQAPMVSLEPARLSDLPEFCKKLQEAFAVAVIEKFGPIEGGPIPSDADVWESFRSPGAAVYHVLSEGKRVGGAVLEIHESTHHNNLSLFFISPEFHSQGFGLAAWKAIEARYPETLVWETGTPYFEERNIHFYVNKCGFHIVEFYNQYHPDPHMNPSDAEIHDPVPDFDGFFRFEKMM